mgnify:CR=1 FL=1
MINSDRTVNWLHVNINDIFLWKIECYIKSESESDLFALTGLKD